MKKQSNSKSASKTPVSKPAPQAAKTPSRALLRKTMAGVGALLLVVLCIWSVRACSHHVYGRTVKEFKANASLAVKLATTMFNEMVAQGARAETDAIALNPQGQAVACDSPAKAMDWRKQAFQQDGTMEAYAELMKQIDNISDEAVDAPSAYQTEGQALSEALGALDSIKLIIEKPGNNVIVLAETAERLTQTATAALEKTDFHFFLPIEACKVYADRIAPLMKKSDMMENLLYQEVNIDARPVNAMKYLKKGYQPLPDGNGVLYKVLKQGNGPVATTDSQVQLHYEGKLLSGKVFDSSYSRGTPAVMRPAQTVRGFNKALTSMPVGSKWEVFIPSDQAYGSRGTGEIQPNSDLLFTIEVLRLMP